MFERKPLVVTGMHRSGTSLVAQVLVAAGVDLGVDRSPASRDGGGGSPERKGHFEDKRFVALHERVIQRFDSSGRLLWEPDGPLAPDEAEIGEARGLVEARSSASPWGWKDPRTVLFLDFWAELLPEAVFLFVFRRPEHVVDSLRRRGDRELLQGVGALARFRYGRAIRAWSDYNQRLLDFVEAHPTRSCLFEIDTFVEDPTPILDCVRSHLGIPLDPVDLLAIYDPALTGRQPHPRVMRSVGKSSDAARLYERLRSAAE